MMSKNIDKDQNVDSGGENVKNANAAAYTKTADSLDAAADNANEFYGYSSDEEDDEEDGVDISAEKPKPGLKDIAMKAAAVLRSDQFRDAFTLTVTLLIFVLAATASIYYIFVASQGEFHSDCVDTLMWANASHESGHVFDKDFWYPCLLPFGTGVIMQPLISVFGLSMNAQHFGMLGYFLLLMLFMFLTLREMKINVRAILLFMTGFIGFTLCSRKMREMYYQHTIYYTLGILFCFIGLFLFFHMVNLGEKAKADKDRFSLKIRYWITFGFLCLFILFTATDGITGLSVFGLPFIAGILAERIVDDKKDILGLDSLKLYIKVAALCLMIYLGQQLLAYWQGDILIGYTDAHSRFSSKDLWLEHARTVALNWLNMFGVCGAETQELQEATFTDDEGLVNIIKIVTAGIVAVIPIIATVFYKKLNAAVKIFIWIHWAVTTVVLLGCVFGTLLDDGADWRIIPAVSTAIVVSLLFIGCSFSLGETIKRVAVVMGAVIALFSYTCISDTLRTPSNCYEDNYWRIFQLSDCLKENDLKYGYASFWRANAVTVISSSDVKVRDVNIDQNGVSRRWYMSSLEWYKDQPGVDKYFLLMDEWELNTVLGSPDAVMLTEATEQITPVINNQVFHIFVFDHNIMP